MTALYAFFLRDFRVALTYRVSFVTQFIAIAASIVTLSFVSDLVGAGQGGELDAYGGEYFGFALVGTTISLLSYPAVRSFAGAVRGGQVTGTLEAILITKARPLPVVLGGGAYSITQSGLELALGLGIGALVFGADLKLTALPIAALVIAMTLVIFVGIGLLSAAFTLAFKQSEPFSGMLLGSSMLLSGTIYPTTVLPGWLEVLAPFIPLTHSIELARQVMLDGAVQDSAMFHFVALAGFCLLLPAGIYALSRSLTYARETGALTGY